MVVHSAHIKKVATVHALLLNLIEHISEGIARSELSED